MSEPRQSASRKNVILVAMDQLRADHLHCYGYPRKTSPSIDTVARSGVLFTRMYASASWTTPSYTSVMTSLFPSTHHPTLLCPGPEGPLLDTRVSLLAEQFKKGGYRTVAFVNNSLAGGRMIGRGFGEFFQRQEVAPSIAERIMDEKEMTSGQAPGMNEKIFAWLEQPRTEPFFMFSLYFEPHSPYDPPPEHDLFKTDAYPGATHTGYDPKTGHLLRAANIGDGEAVERLNSLYDGKIHYVDFYYGQLLDRLQELGLNDNTVVAFFSDHGELIYEHPDILTFDHVSLYDANVHVPFIIKGKGIPEGNVAYAIVSHIDIAPTLLEIADLPALPGAQGTSLLPLITGDATSVSKYVFSEQDTVVPMRSVRDAQYKLIHHVRTGMMHLFDTMADPGERDDIATQEPELARRLFGVLKQWMKDYHLSEQEQQDLWRKTPEDRSCEIVDDVTTSGLADGRP